jgi:hypothetical protein
MTGRGGERGGVRTPQADIISGKLGNIADWIEDGAGD